MDGKGTSDNRKTNVARLRRRAKLILALSAVAVGVTTSTPVLASHDGAGSYFGMTRTTTGYIPGL
jgi:hypothetical protein